LIWKVIAHVSSAIGVLVNVNWSVIFTSLYKIFRVNVSVRDSEKIRPSKLFEFEQCFFHIKFDVEKNLEGDEGNGDNNDDDKGQEDQQ
jgi:hypothetical protein